MIENISSEDLDFLETIEDSIALSEILFHDFDNLEKFEESWNV